ncbi:methyltransferase TYW3-domain-containing protein [Annulohypoxylon truncatum]|uniref:methyltransferase TYW3-domain-containing protein n=1 Tax=Annulohypoxylon truncatum TaxID=327061 RepID=UPI002008D1B9|nr:methyltransferase TYW3-domain-containing protein [Annulohypoxylon truncatum]KAI1211870.1 methyltransferase TYW3-domain-containing protein [Annulohypoxylon truncatum]
MKGLTLPASPPSFVHRKERILAQLAVPEQEYTDASPKGSVDVGIRELIDEINGVEGFVTTSSCAGRVSVFREGRRKGTGVGAGAGAGVGDGEEGLEQGNGDRDGVAEGEGEGRKLAGVGGKGGGGNWLFVSHDPVPLEGDGEPERDLETLLGLKGIRETENQEVGDGQGDGALRDVTATRLVHLKFEPMILHVLTASPEHAQLLLRCGLQAGFRESGAVSLTAPAGEQHATPMVAIRSMGLSFESLIGHQSGDGGDKIHCTVSSAYLRTLIRIGNERFVENTKRIERFRAALAEATKPSNKNEEAWEDAESRRRRKREEGLRRREMLEKSKCDDAKVIDVEDEVLDIPLDVNLT